MSSTDSHREKDENEKERKKIERNIERLDRKDERDRERCTILFEIQVEFTKKNPFTDIWKNWVRILEEFCQISFEIST